MPESHNRNPKGNNGHAATHLSDEVNEEIATYLRRYHAEGISSNSDIRQRLNAEIGVDLGLSSIKKRRNTLGLFGARSKQSAQTPKELEQAVLTQLDRDPAKGTPPFGRNAFTP